MGECVQGCRRGDDCRFVWDLDLSYPRAPTHVNKSDGNAPWTKGTGAIHLLSACQVVLSRAILTSSEGFDIQGGDSRKRFQRRSRDAPALYSWSPLALRPQFIHTATLVCITLFPSLVRMNSARLISTPSFGSVLVLWNS